MKYLLDTSVALAIGNGTEAAAVTNLVNDSSNDVFISVVVLWEIAIKSSLGKLDIGMSLMEFADGFMVQGYSMLYVLPAHVYTLSGLKSIHKDPFDRLLIAQSEHEGMLFLTNDARLPGYGQNIKFVSK